MTEYEVVVTSNAVEDIYKIYNYVVERSLDCTIAQKQTIFLVDAMRTLSVLPNRIKPMEITVKSIPIRRLLAGNYSIIFRINGSMVEILHIYSNKQDIEQELRSCLDEKRD